MRIRTRLVAWATAHPTATELGGGAAAGLVTVAASLWQWGATSDGLFRGLTLGTWLAVLVAIILRRRRRKAERAAAAALEERLRLARELHDTVAGAVGAIGIQAAAARRVLDRRPGEAAAALERIELVTRAANEDLRRMLVALRDGAPVPAEREVGLAGLGALVADTRAAGPDVRLELDPAALGLHDRGVDHAAFRIVQEALTNVVRHAGPVPASVTVTMHGSTLEISVVNDLPRTPRSQPGAGLGLVGMRERAARLGGRVEVEVRTDGRYGVRALLPIAATGAGHPDPERAASG